MSFSSPRFTFTVALPLERRYLPELVDLIWNQKINPGKVFYLTL